MSNYITFIDTTGRNIVGTVNSATTDTHLVVDNPVMVLVQPQQNGQLSVQLIPLFIGEFIKTNAAGSREFRFVYNKASIAIGENFELDERIIVQYQRIVDFSAGKQTNNSSPDVIKLFDE